MPSSYAHSRDLVNKIALERAFRAAAALLDRIKELATVLTLRDSTNPRLWRQLLRPAVRSFLENRRTLKLDLPEDVLDAISRGRDSDAGDIIVTVAGREYVYESVHEMTQKVYLSCARRCRHLDKRNILAREDDAEADWALDAILEQQVLSGECFAVAQAVAARYPEFKAALAEELQRALGRLPGSAEEEGRGESDAAGGNGIAEDPEADEAAAPASKPEKALAAANRKRKPGPKKATKYPKLMPWLREQLNKNPDAEAPDLLEGFQAEFPNDAAPPLHSMRSYMSLV